MCSVTAKSLEKMCPVLGNVEGKLAGGRSYPVDRRALRC